MKKKFGVISHNFHIPLSEEINVKQTNKNFINITFNHKRTTITIKYNKNIILCFI